MSNYCSIIQWGGVGEISASLNKVDLILKAKKNIDLYMIYLGACLYGLYLPVSPVEVALDYIRD